MTESIPGALEKAGFKRADFEFYAHAMKFLKSGGTVERAIEIVNRAAERKPGEGQMSCAPQGQDAVADARPASGEGHNGTVRPDQPSAASPARDPSPLPDEGHVASAQQGQGKAASVRDQASGSGQSVGAREGHGPSAPPARPPNKPRGLDDARRARMAVETIFDTHLLGGRPLRGMTRDSMAAVHTSSARKLKRGLRDTAATAYDFVFSDQALKHCQADGNATAEQMFKPSDIERFDRNARELIEKSADAVADVAFSYINQKTVELSNAGA